MTPAMGATGGVRPWIVAIVAAVLVALPLAAASGAAPRSQGIVDSLEWQLLEAETAIRNGEPRIAESHYRAAAREVWLLSGLLAAEAGDLTTARNRLDLARNAAATDLHRARVALARVELELGEVEQPLKELRLVTQERPDDVALRVLFAQALRRTGRLEEFQAELDPLRRLDPRAADALVAETSEVQRASGPPTLDGLQPLPPEQRRSLYGRLIATQVRIARNLAALSLTTDGAGTPATPLPPTDRPESDLQDSAAPYGTLDLSADLPPLARPTVAPFQLDPVALLADAPPSLRGAIETLDRGDTSATIAELRGFFDAPTESAARALLGQILAAGGDVEAAEAELRHAAEASPPSAAAAGALGRLLWLTDRPQPAIVYLRRTAAAGPLDRDLALALADVESEAGNLGAAGALLRSVDKRFGSAEALLRLVDVHRGLGELKRALDAADRATVLAPNSEGVLAAHAVVALDAGIVPSAARSVEPLVRMHPRVARYRLLLGRVWAERRQMGEAAEAFLAAVDLDAGLIEAYLPLGLALLHETRFEESAERLRHYLKARPDDLEAIAGLAEAEER
ncbi:MAG: tetratricopeptide repeat protein, partial [Acidobacteriota bacterium]